MGSFADNNWICKTLMINKGQHVKYEDLIHTDNILVITFHNERNICNTEGIT